MILFALFITLCLLSKCVLMMKSRDFNLGIEAGIPRLVAGIFTTPLRKHVSSLDTCIRGGVSKILANKRGILGSISEIKLESQILSQS